MKSLKSKTIYNLENYFIFLSSLGRTVRFFLDYLKCNRYYDKIKVEEKIQG